jgi:Bifunctional DNA primase/polymerase, N-terminal
MTTLLDAALILAERGWPVFPCGENKRPVVEHGFLSASTDPEIIRALFGKPGAVMIGVPTGPRSGFDVLDLDPRHGSDAWENENRHLLPETRVHQTGGGGRHILFDAHPRMRNSAGKIAPGVDVRGTGGYIIVPPSPGYTLLQEAPLATWPEWLLPLALPKPKPPPPPEPPPSAAAQKASNKRIEGFIASVLFTVESAQDGQKHEKLLNAAITLGGILHQTDLTVDDLVNRLIRALPASTKDHKLAENTARWGVIAGQDKPITLEDRKISSAGGAKGGGPPPGSGSGPEPTPTVIQSIKGQWISGSSTPGAGNISKG